ncbi:MAG: transglycosylase domain-containing protein [Muribaculaceae bacterium]|nr:transglycosylase domain-containing protein [Muribaculaceae bacterium]
MNKKNKTSNNKQRGKELNPIAKRRRIVKIMWKTFGYGLLFMLVFFILLYNGIIGYMPSIEDITNPNSKYASFIYTADGVEMGRYYSGSGNRVYTSMDEIPQHMIDALVSTEDVRFYDHSGIDTRALVRALVKRGILQQKNAGGASTLTQQLAKQIYTEKPAENGFKRMLQKPVEWMIALKLERYYSKDEIIKMYLNQFDFLYNAVGVKMAAKVYFDKEPSDLTVEEAATLVGMVKNPSYFNPVRHPERTRDRRNTVLHQMYKAKRLSKSEFEELKEKPLKISFNRPQNHTDGIAPYFREELRRYLTATKPEESDYKSWDKHKYYSDSIAWKNDPLYGWCEKNGYDLYRDGLKIYTTIDSRMQRYAEDAVESQMKHLQKYFGTTRYKNKYKLYSDNDGEIDKKGIDKLINTSIRHSDRYRVAKNAGKEHSEIMKEFKTPVEMTVFSYNGPRHVTMTPYDSVLYYAQYLRAGFMAMDAIDGHIKAYVGGVDYKYFKYDMVSIGRRQIGSTAKPFLYAAAIEKPSEEYSPSTKIECDAPDWHPKGSRSTMMTLKEALTRSNNGASARLIYDIGIKRMLEQMSLQGITTQGIKPNKTIALGSCEVPLKEMCVGYSAFANQGYTSYAMMVTRIADRDGNTIAVFTPRQNHSLTPRGYEYMLDMMQSVAKNGTGKSMTTLEAQMGGKTGTTDYSADGWFIGFTPKLVFGAWVGGENRYIHTDLQGAKTALPICKKFMSKVYANDRLYYSRKDKFVVSKKKSDSKKPESTRETDDTDDDPEEVFETIDSAMLEIEE